MNAEYSGGSNIEHVRISNGRKFLNECKMNLILNAIPNPPNSRHLGLSGPDGRINKNQTAKNKQPDQIERPNFNVRWKIEVLYIV